MDEFRATIKAYVKKNGLNIKTVAEDIGISRQNYYDIMSGKQRMNIEFYLSLCKYLGKEPAYFFTTKTSALKNDVMKQSGVTELTVWHGETGYFASLIVEKNKQLAEKDVQIKELHSLLNKALER